MYCTRADMEGFFGVENVTEWADLDSTGDAAQIEARITEAIANAASEIDGTLRASFYKLPLRTATGAVPDQVKVFCKKLAGVDLYERKAGRNMDEEGQAGHGIRGHRQEVLAILQQIATGTRRLDAMY